MDKDVPYIEYESEGQEAANANYMGANASGVINNERKGTSEAEDYD